jgi:cation diffusion facilitator CzcD-associated flavoprotein CzcO
VPPTESVDVLIVGAGLSGIGAAVHLQRRCPSKSFAILEARAVIGGTWDLFRFPGVRSDSDMYTLGYSFRPWAEAKAIADGSSIRRYISDTAREAGIDGHIRFGHKVTRASWSSDTALWTIEALRGAAAPARLCCRFLYVCGGYFSYESAYRPSLPHEERYGGMIVHPQFWPEHFDYTGKRVIVIGSGATAVTLIPEMAKRAAHVTMLQRSPSYVFSLPTVDLIAQRLRRWLPARMAYPLVRMKNVLIGMAFFQLARRRPELAKKRLLRMVQNCLPPDFDIQRHFTPRYNPWDQRVCVVTDGDLFKAIGSGAVSVVTDEIDAFTAGGIRLKSGAELPADIVVAATGLKLSLLGGNRVHGRRRSNGHIASHGLQGSDARRHAEYGVHLRIHQCILDAQGRPHRQLCLPLAPAHGVARLRHRHSAAGSGARRRAISELHFRLCSPSP